MIRHLNHSPAGNGSFHLSGCLLGCLDHWWVVEAALMGNSAGAVGILNLSLHHPCAGILTHMSFFSFWTLVSMWPLRPLAAIKFYHINVVCVCACAHVRVWVYGGQLICHRCYVFTLLLINKEIFWPIFWQTEVLEFQITGSFFCCPSVAPGMKENKLQSGNSKELGEKKVN